MSNRLKANSSGIDPVEFKIVVRPVEVDKTIKFKGGGSLIRPDETHERDQHAAMEGTLVAVSPFAFTYEEWPAGVKPPSVGETVIFARYSGINVTGADGRDYRIMNDKDLVAVRRA